MKRHKKLVGLRNPLGQDRNEPEMAPAGNWNARSQSEAWLPVRILFVLFACCLVCIFPERLCSQNPVFAIAADTAFLIGSLQGRPQSPAAAQGNQSATPTGGLATIEGHTPSKVLDGTAVRVSHYKPENKLRLALAIQPPHMAEEEEFLKELTIKGSPNFHKFLTPEEWNARFAPSPEDEQKVVDWVVSQGLTVTHRYANRLLVDVEGPVGTIEKTFGVTINDYQVDDEVDFANDRDPVVPASLNGILYSVLGLNSIDRVHAGLHKGKDVKGPDYVPGPAYLERESSQGEGDPTKSPAAVRAALKAGEHSPRPSFTNNFADPGDIFSSEAYNWDGLQAFSHCCNLYNDSDGSPKETSIALATYASFNASDVNTFFEMYGFAWNWTPLAINGAGGTPGTECDTLNSGCTGPGVDDEATLDLEYSTAASNNYGPHNGTAHVFIYEGVNQDYDTTTDMFNYMVNDEHARVMSTSWSGAEVTSGNGYTYWEVPNHAIFNNMAGLGWTLIGAADDQGSTGNCSTISVNFPASDNNFVAAGGTALKLYTNGNWDYEVAWTGGTGSNDCQSNDGGGGGGISVLWPQPSWQSRYTAIAALGSMRLEPDLALNAGGIGQNFYYQGALSPVGGTSIVAPELAGFFAQENTYLSYIGSICGSGGTAACTPIGNPNPWMYAVGGSGAPHDPYYDITSGCTSNNITVANDLTPWCAGTGFDLATGWGSANMMQLAWGINWQYIPGAGEPVITFTQIPTTNVWYNTDVTVAWTVTDSSINSMPAPGVAGFTQGWDSIPADPSSEPHGGSGNSFYSGPEYPFYTSGCLAFTGTTACAGGVSQGCHTVNVRAWDNQGVTATSTYGPLCYDTVPPTLSISTTPATPANGWYKGSVVMTLKSADPGGSNASGVAATYYGVGFNGSANVYSGPVTFSAQGENQIYYFSEDNAGNYSCESSTSPVPGNCTSVPYISVNIDTTPPVATASLTGNLTSGKYFSDVQVTLAATDNLSGVADTYYTLDGGSQVTYSVPFTVTAIGSHSVKYWAVDVAGNVEATLTKTFTIAGFPAAMTSPTSGSTLTATSVKFTWSVETGGSQYDLHLSAVAPGGYDLYVSGHITGTSATVSGLPTNGEKIYARLYTILDGVTLYNDYTYTAASIAALISPAPSSTLTANSVKFTWSTGTAVSQYDLHLSAVAPGGYDLYLSGHIAGTSTTVNGLPTNGETIYARLYTILNGVTLYNDYTYTAASLAKLTSPAPGSSFTATSVKFTWSTATAVSQYDLHLSAVAPGGYDLYLSGHIAGTSTTVNGLPTNGQTIYARLYTILNGVTLYNDYTYTAK